MQHAVGLQQPAGLIVDEVEQRAAGQRRQAVLQRVGADAIDVPGAVRIDQSFRIGDYHGGLDRRDAERDLQFLGNRGTDLHQFGKRRETGVLHAEAIHAERQPFDHQRAVALGIEIPPDLV